ncbi:MAG: glutathione peroxidase [Chromatiales bacterium]|nr:glutathione peroxidase [Chromatiales bacterium]
MQDFQADRIDGSGNLVPDLKGKVVLAVNVASKCGLTPQYKGLEQLYGDLQGDGFVVVGFPCNQFGGQEPGTEEEIVQFCQAKYDVTFPLARKLEVNGPGRHPIYQWLTTEFPGDIEWNFEKFLIGRDGKVVRRYPPATKPDDKGLLQDIADLLQERL